MANAPQYPGSPPAAPQLPSKGIVVVPIAGVQESAPGVPGAVHLTGADGLSPKIEVNGEKASKGMGQTYKVPMQDGSVGKLKMTSTFPGYPKLDFNGQRVLQIPLPPAYILWVAFVPLVFLVLAFGLVGIVSAIGLHYLYMWMLKRPTWGNAVKILVPLATTAVLAYPIILLNRALAQAIFG